MSVLSSQPGLPPEEANIEDVILAHHGSTEVGMKSMGEILTRWHYVVDSFKDF